MTFEEGMKKLSKALLEDLKRVEELVEEGNFDDRGLLDGQIEGIKTAILEVSVLMGDA